MDRIAFWKRPRDLVVDVLLGSFVIATAFAPLEPDHEVPTITVLPFLGGAAIVLLLRRRFPIGVLAVVTALGAGAAAAGSHTPALEIPVAIAMYTVGRTRPRRLTLITAAVLALLLPIGEILQAATRVTDLAGLLSPGVIQPAVVIAFAAALGSAIRANDAVLLAAEERADRAEQSRESEAQRRVAEDRLAIARDLHDSVAHRIAVINLHSGVAAKSVRNDPDTAADSIAVIGESARSVLAEIQSMLLLLRSGADRGSDELGLDHLDSLLGVFARSGLQIRTRRSGSTDDLPASTSGVVYRVVQEGLTNAYKHGTDRVATMSIVREHDALVVEIRNPVMDQPIDAARGHGLIGMRERISSADGTMRAGIDGSEFTLVASLPVRSSSIDRVSA